MRMPGRSSPGGSGCWDDTGGGCLPDGVGSGSGGGAGVDLLFLKSPAAQASGDGGLPVCAGDGLGISGIRFRDLPGRPADGGCAGDPPGSNGLFSDSGKKIAGIIFLFLESGGAAGAADPAARQKKFGICKKNVCIWGKMGYNKMA